MQGLANAFILMRYPFNREEAKQFDKDIFETIYYAALTASKKPVKEYRPYESYPSSPISQGSFSLICGKSNHRIDGIGKNWPKHSEIWPQELLIAPMSTASTSQVLGNNVCFEPFTSNIYIRRVLSGEFIVVNKYSLRDLVKLGLWNDTLKDKIIADNGSIQNIEEIAQELKNLYKTVWEIKQKHLLDIAADRGAFIDQSQSLNLFMQEVNVAKLSSAHFYAWKKGLKTGMYYLRTKAAADAIKFMWIKVFLNHKS